MYLEVFIPYVHVQIFVELLCSQMLKSLGPILRSLSQNSVIDLLILTAFSCFVLFFHTIVHVSEFVAQDSDCSLFQL